MGVRKSVPKIFALSRLGSYVSEYLLQSFCSHPTGSASLKLLAVGKSLSSLNLILLTMVFYPIATGAQALAMKAMGAIHRSASPLRGAGD
jgi:hypothetical protein